MIKAVKTSLILILLCLGVPQGHAQATAQDDAGAEAVRRQANTILMRKTIDEARTARVRGETDLAIRKYETAWTLSGGLLNVDPERQQIQSELVPIRLELMKQAEAKGNLAEANKQVTAALRINPNDDAARKAKVDVDQRLAATRGKRPDEKTTKRADEFNEERIATATQVQNARFLIEMGRLDEAEKLLKQAAKEDPESRPTFYYLDLIKEQKYAQEARKREISYKDSLVEVEKSWNPPIARELLPSPNPFANTNLVYTSPSRQALYKKLDTITIDEFPLPSDVELVEVLKELNSEIKKRDIGGKGINLIISQGADRPLPIAGVGAVDPVTGLPAAAPSTPDVDVEKFRIKFDPPIRNVTLKQFLDAIVVVAKQPAENAASNVGLKYSVEDYAIVFSQRNTTAEPEPMFSRTFKVNPNTFKDGLQGVFFTSNPFQGLVSSAGGGAAGGGGGGIGGGQQGQNGQGGGPGGFFSFGGSSTQGGAGGGGGGGQGQNGQGTGIQMVTVQTNISTLQSEVRAFFSAAGVDFPTNAVAGFGGGAAAFGGGAGLPGQPAQKALFFNDRAGILFVRAPLRDLDIVENALHALNVTPPLISIEAKFAEFSQVDSKGLGFDWFLGNALLGNGRMGVQGGTAPSFGGTPTAANPVGTFPNPAIAQSSTDQLLTGGLRQSAPTIATFSGILTDPQFRVAIHAIENRQGVDLLSAPNVTTVSGRQARISVEETRTIIVGLQVQGLGGGGGVAGAGGGLAGGGVTTP